MRRASLFKRTAVWLTVISFSPAIQVQASGPRFQEERIVVDAKVNQHPACLLFDTGASFSALFSSSSERLKVELGSTSETMIGGHTVQAGFSKPLDFSMLGRDLKIPVKVVMIQGPPGIDGVFGWRDLTSPFALIDGIERRISVLREAPTTGWQRWPIEKDNTQLFFTVTKQGKPLGRVFVDLGSSAGLRLSPPLWKEWRAANPGAPVTLEALRYFAGKPAVREVAWAQEYRLGDLMLRNVDIGTIPEALEEKAVDGAGKEFIATMGIRTLRNLRLVISQENGELFTQSVSQVPQHNRGGVIFLKGAEMNSPFVAHVLKGCPADEAGLQNGDVLLEIDGVDFSIRRKDVPVEPNGLFSQPAGTELKLKVVRSGSPREIILRLRDILP